MIRDARVFILLNNDVQPIINDALNHYYSTPIRNEIAVFRIHNEPAHGYLLISVSDDVDKIIIKHGGIEQYDLTYQRLRENPNVFPFLFGDKSLTESLKYVITNSPRHAYISGQSGTEYRFFVFNISDEVNHNSPGVYIFTVTVKDNGVDAHKFKSFVSVNRNNAEEIEKAKLDGARFFWYCYSASESERKQIIEDISSVINYRADE